MGIRHQLRRRLWTLGLDVSRFTPEARPVARRRRLFEVHGIDVVLDVGASGGDWGQELRDDVGFTGPIRSFEPTSTAFKALQARAERDANWDVFNFALGDIEDEHTIHIAGNSDSSSILGMLPAHETAAPESKFVGEETISVRTLDEIFDEVCPKGASVYLKIDTQGYEGRVLRGAESSLSRIDVVQLEMSLVPMYAGELSLVELLELMFDQGYELIGLDPGFTDPRTGNVLQVDGIFHRPRGHARALSLARSSDHRHEARAISASTTTESESQPDRAKICLVLHATVDVRGVVFVKRDDPLERFNDYRWALNKWVSYGGIDKLIFVENSGYDISELQRIVDESNMPKHAVEFLSYDGQDFPRELGKGFGETLNFEHVIRNSTILSPDDRLIRNNGRYYVENMGAFFEALQPPTEILSELRQYLSYADATLLGGTVDFIERYVCPYGRQVNDSKGYYFEHALARAVHRALADGLVWRPFPEPPLVRGFSGTSNENKTESFLVRSRQSLKHRVRLRVLRA